MSRGSSAAIQALLECHYERVGVTVINDLADLEELVRSQPDLVFLGMKFLSGADRKVWLSEYLDDHGIAYTGSPREAIELERDKPLAKRRVLESGLATSPFFIAQPGEYGDDSLPLAFPLFVKPTSLGGGRGINEQSVITNMAAFHEKVQAIADNLHSASLVEQYLPGREFSVALLEDEYSGDLMAMPIELVAEADIRGNRILGGTIKSSNSEVVSTITDKNLRQRIIQLASAVYYALGARDYGRIDIRLDQYGRPHFLEANLLPSLITDYGSFPKACVLNRGMDYETMILRIVRLGLARGSRILPEIAPSDSIVRLKTYSTSTGW